MRQPIIRHQNSKTKCILNDAQQPRVTNWLLSLHASAEASEVETRTTRVLRTQTYLKQLGREGTAETLASTLQSSLVSNDQPI